MDQDFSTFHFSDPALVSTKSSPLILGSMKGNEPFVEDIDDIKYPRKNKVDAIVITAITKLFTSDFIFVI